MSDGFTECKKVNGQEWILKQIAILEEEIRIKKREGSKIEDLYEEIHDLAILKDQQR